jgi:hypothetical protein
MVTVGITSVEGHSPTVAFVMTDTDGSFRLLDFLTCVDTDRGRVLAWAFGGKRPVVSLLWRYILEVEDDDRDHRLAATERSVAKLGVASSLIGAVAPGILEETNPQPRASTSWCPIPLKKSKPKTTLP